ncbi:BsuPI-related putative proteinase inhibitor [Pseudoneobacillus rhizosphaerae]|uniref:SLH domain-containing protein n=1 Tax=Pseudoneobacillus rhizosphaerae TaxID=2880968 RepID=A0A9C7L8Y7_9BACI|nr:BsuPI-related putative proteinase inhibitor [Pseudoneobacillus rhizosphaerae]CAG9606647.1 hypothetical protein NEOCIP111885_00335 [Pseudoneobacillus rhizosphaerae]
MKKWLILFSAFVLLVPTSTLASVDGNHSTKEISQFEITNQKLSLEDKYSFLKKKGVLKGKPDGLAHFDKELTRAELAVSLYRLFKLEKPLVKIAPLTDTTKHWAKDEILAVTLQGWMDTDNNRKFHPNKKMTIEEVAQVLVKAAELNVDEYASIWLPASNWAQGYMAAVLTENFLSGEEDYRKMATRSHLVYSLYELSKYVDSNKGIWEGSMEPKLAVKANTEDDYRWTFTVKNQTEKEQIVNISASQFDYILKKDGKKIEQYTDNKRWIMLYKETILKQGEELTYTGEFLNLKPGKYELEIWLIDSNWPDAKTKVEFEVK